jgi:phage protein U
MIGSYGNVIFEVSRSKVLTFDNFKRVKKANFAQHKIINRKPVLESTGSALDTIDYSIHLNVNIGISPKDELKKLSDIIESGEEQKLIIGGDVIGDFVLIQISEEQKKIDIRGRILIADVTLKLLEYVNE